MTKPVVIVGASMGGLRAAEALRRFGYLGPITAIGDEPYSPYNRPPLSKEVLANEVSHEAVAFAQRPATADVNWVLGTRAESADLEHRTVTDSNGQVHPYSALIIATGLRPKRLQVSNSELAGRHAVRTLDDAIALRAALVPGARVVILGAGFIGCEVAATARKLGCDVTVVPATASFDDIMAHAPDGLFLSNGPGDPAATGVYAVPVIQKWLETKKPLFGICLGHQMLGLAVGAKTEKMHQGHRGANHPVKRLIDGAVEITSMNHGFAVDAATLPANAKATHISLFDGSNCGFELADQPAFSVQYHPEASPGPQDSHYLFEKFAGMMK